MTEHLGTDRRPHVWTGNQHDGWRCTDADCSATIPATPARMTADLPALLDSLEAAAAAATPGPWATDVAPRMVHNMPRGRIKGGYVAGTEHEADAALIVAAVNALPVLVAELRRHQAAAQAVRELAGDYDRGTTVGVIRTEVVDRIRAAVAALDPKEPS